MNTPENSAPNVSLYSCTSVEDGFSRREGFASTCRRTLYNGVHVNWYVYDRPDGYADRFAGLFDLDDPFAQGVIEQSFTAEEALRFAAYQKDKHGSHIVIKPIELPVPNDAIGSGSLPSGGNVSTCTLSLAVKTACALCDHVDRPDTPYAAFLDGPGWQWVCQNCLDKHNAMPGLWRALDLFNGLVIMLMRGKSLEFVSKAITHEMDCGGMFPFQLSASCAPDNGADELPPF